MHEMIAVDLGSEFFGFQVDVGGKIVCVVTPKVEYDSTAREMVRDLVKRQGGDCASCRGCLIGRLEN